MKRILLLLALLGPITLHAQSFLWPVAGKQAGEDILSQPQAYIGEELNFSELFIGTEAGAVILCPADGVVVNVGAVYYKSLSYCYSYGLEAGQSITELVREVRKKDGTPFTGDITLRLPDGKKLFMQGFLSERHFKTGEKLQRGDTLGTADYSFHAWKTPSLMLSVSDKAGKPADPMTPFGLKTTFKKAEQITREDPMPAAKIQEDLTVLEDAICELYPSLKDRMGEENFRALMDSVKTSVTGPMDITLDFRILLRKLLHRLPDSHMGLLPDPIATAPSSGWMPGELLSFCDDTVRILITVPEYKKYEGKVVKSINGEPAASYARRAAELLNIYDGGVQSAPLEQSVLLGRYSLMMHPHGAKGDAHVLELEDGTSVRIPFSAKPRMMANETYRRMARWAQLNLQKGDNDVFETLLLNDSTAYLGIKTFDMLEAQLDGVRSFLSGLQVPNLIIDVRNNSGGESKVLMSILSCLTDVPMDRQKGGYARVNKQGDFASLRYSLNYSAEADVFPDYVPGADGFFYTRDTLETCPAVLPDPQIQYTGRLYVLTNGTSFSASTLLPGVLVRNRRGVSVGRETGTGYHYMTAFKFADIQLPNTLQTIHIPLVQLVFDTTVCERLPEGRGLLPDYPLPLTYNEVTGGPDGETDVMLEYALQLIAEGKYLSEEDPFALADLVPSKGVSPYLLAGIIAMVLLLVAVFFPRKKR